MKNVLIVSAISSSSKLGLGFWDEVVVAGVWGIGGVTVPTSCGVQTAGDSVKFEDGVEISVEVVPSDSSESSDGDGFLVCGK